MHPATLTSTSPTIYERLRECFQGNKQAVNNEQPPQKNDTANTETNVNQALLNCSPNTAGGASNSRCARFLSNVRTFFTNLWHYKLDVGLGLLSIAGGLVIIFVVDIPTVFGSEALTKGLPFFMIGAGTTKILGAFRNAYVDTCNSGHSINSHFGQYRYVPPKDELREDPRDKNANSERGDTGNDKESENDAMSPNLSGLVKGSSDQDLVPSSHALSDTSNPHSSLSPSSSSSSNPSDSLTSTQPSPAQTATTTETQPQKIANQPAATTPSK